MIREHHGPYCTVTEKEEKKMLLPPNLGNLSVQLVTTSIVMLLSSKNGWAIHFNFY